MRKFKKMKIKHVVNLIKTARQSKSPARFLLLNGLNAKRLWNKYGYGPEYLNLSLYDLRLLGFGAGWFKDLLREPDGLHKLVDAGYRIPEIRNVKRDGFSINPMVSWSLLIDTFTLPELIKYGADRMLLAYGITGNMKYLDPTIRGIHLTDEGIDKRRTREISPQEIAEAGYPFSYL